MKRYADDLTGGHEIEVHTLPDGRVRARVTNRPDLEQREWFGTSESAVTIEALNDLARMEQADEL